MVMTVVMAVPSQRQMMAVSVMMPMTMTVTMVVMAPPRRPAGGLIG
jgi:hypothetical protein